ncbi:AAA family ATPase [Candidatus Methylospira mobilis]|uniref:Gluconokinase n=1 Tax=Candidatus Methylospira mobilis TaxID=1808979 RepID=A0A5Q0BD80_9GAMM|nr:gluconokinase, GntK/IdnK-type [Candidatus Methylospira mobilis]QFY41815.1 AAA family ATPase [Candidatus Methylospira mobilis]
MMVVICGVTGSGKTSIALQLAYELGWHYIEGDDYHPVVNIEKMRRGIPLSDADRRPWLDALAHDLTRFAKCRLSFVATCSALKRDYRDRLRSTVPGIVFIQLTVAPDMLRKRVEARSNHFAGANLIDSQLMTFEALSADEGLIIEATGEIEDIVTVIRTKLNNEGMEAD